MAPPSDKDFTYGSVTVVRRDVIYLLAEPDNHACPAVFFKYKPQAPGSQENLSFGAVRIISFPGREFLVIGADGDVWGLRGTQNATRLTGHLDPTSPDGPGSRGWIRDARAIDGLIYAVGMSRQAYVRDERDVWHHIDGDVLSKPGEIVGFNAVDGFSSKEIYAVGLKGAIWRYTGKEWFSVPSPTNVALNAVRCVGDYVYIVGVSGIVLKGRLDRFRVLDKQADEENLYAVEGFGDDVYVASQRELFRLKGDVLGKVPTKLGEITAGSLSSRDGVLWSVGAKHLIWTDDGKKWTQVFI